MLRIISLCKGPGAGRNARYQILWRLLRIRGIIVRMKRDHIITDSLERAEDYYHVHAAFERAFAFLRQDALAELPTADCTLPETAYDAAKDIEFFKDEPKSWTTVQAGSFIVFFPEVAHAPLVSDGEIHKAVLKIAVE